VRVRTLSLTDFRNYSSVELELSGGLTALVGANGEGKSNILEALAWLTTLSSFRGAPTEALVRKGAPFAIVRATVERDRRELLIESQLQRSGRTRVQVNQQPLRRARELLGLLRATVFTPDDLELVKGGPADRRRFLDEVLIMLHPRNDALRAEVERIIRQRTALLKQAGGRLDDAALVTLDVWDAKLASAGEALAVARSELLQRLQPALAATYDAVARRPVPATATYEAPWRQVGLGEALARARGDDVRRGVCTVGPHRDDVALTINGSPARTHASQGEMRTLALALRLAVHQVVTDETGAAPVVLLDDVFSELDVERSRALLANLPDAQTVVTAADGLPTEAQPDVVLRVAGGTITPVD
jgi:DNA replication and repair protein RecF